jgi:hypothetical protein
MNQFELPLSGNYLPEAFRLHLFNALESRGWTDLARESASDMRSAALWLGLAAFVVGSAANVVASVVGDSAPPLAA